MWGGERKKERKLKQVTYPQAFGPGLSCAAKARNAGLEPEVKCERGKDGANQIDENLRVPERSYACNRTTYKVSRAKLVLVKKERD